MFGRGGITPSFNSCLHRTSSGSFLLLKILTFLQNCGKTLPQPQPGESYVGSREL